METKKQKITSFTDLQVWQEGHALVLGVYRSTQPFPPEEKFALANQLRRAVSSITSNIAEGFARRNAKERIQFYRIALGSLTETQNQLLAARDLGYIKQSEFSALAKQSISVAKLLQAFIKSANKL
jgi:four helix bundle protein